MARPLQKKKNRSSRPRIRQKTKSKRINIKSNPIVAANWNPTLTLSQNYHRLGLSSKLNSHSGGTEKSSTSTSNPPKEASTTSGKRLGLAIPSSRAPKTLGTEEVRVLRDPKTGAILSVQDSSRKLREKKNPLNDPLNSSDEEVDGDEDEDEVANGNGVGGGRKGGMIVAELEESARYEKKKRPRQQSTREREWCERLVRRWGDDCGGMSRDRRLNPMQQSEGDLRRRVELWKRKEGVGRVEVEEED
ncbi:hypothetical protein JMJ35_001532 [Cladonia borealis]|uniref:Nucleolar protein 16 n=1 Tax=Cladonia borealis TaxID=184061 RepID=A0AA39R8Y7_9LECA|nr:hypothetical protein JMJ35_001532 [Cladonia borealis]